MSEKLNQDFKNPYKKTPRRWTADTRSAARAAKLLGVLLQVQRLNFADHSPPKMKRA